MYEEIQKLVEVICHFKKDKTLILYILDGYNKIKINTMDMINSAYKGKELIYFFSASNDSTNYQLRFETQSLKWYLEKQFSS